MEEEPGATCRYYCHMCSLVVRPAELGVEVVTCPRCHSGFVEEMADGRRSSNATADDAGVTSEQAVPPWPPILMDLLGVSYGPDAGDAAAVVDLAASARRQYQQLAFLQLLNALREDDADGDAPDSGLERLVLVSPTDAHAMLMPERAGSNGAAAAARAPGLTLGELILGPGLDLLLEYLAETDPSRQGTLPAKKEAVAAMPTVRMAAAVTCPVCLDEFEDGGEAREMPCKHRFHDDCIVPWLDAHSSCPVCRYQLPTDEATVTEPTGADGEIAGASSASDGAGDSEGGGRRRWLARPFSRLFSRRWNGSSSSSSSSR